MNVEKAKKKYPNQNFHYCLKWISQVSQKSVVMTDFGMALDQANSEYNNWMKTFSEFLFNWIETGLAKTL